MSPNSILPPTAATAATRTSQNLTRRRASSPSTTTPQSTSKTKTAPTIIMQEKKINRSNSLVNTALKWIPLLNLHYNQNNGTGNCGDGNTTIDGGNNCSTLKQFGSTVAVQKLRESKWFNSDEKRIFCAVIECGFIVEIRCNNEQNNFNNRTMSGTSSTSSSATVSDEENDNNDDILDKIDNELKLQKNMSLQQRKHQQKLITSTKSNLIEDYDDNEQIFNNKHSATNNNNSWFGVVLCKTLKDNKPKQDTIEIFSVKIRQNGVRVFKTTLDTIWTNNWQIRINNFADREKTPHNEKDIKNQISFARKARYSLWHNSKHFAYWCRYGSRQQDVRKRQMSECVKWGSVGMNAGMLLITNNRHRSYTTSK